jgi:hypothetical protein
MSLTVVLSGRLGPPDPLICWSTGPELNRRILVLQTSALATSPPVLMTPLSEASLYNKTTLTKTPTWPCRQALSLLGTRFLPSTQFCQRSSA